MKSISTTRPDRSGGFSIVSAIFILVVLAALGAAIVTVATSQHVSSAIDLQGSRAYWAARSAAEHGLMQVLTPTDVGGPANFAPCMAVPQAITLPGLAEFTTSITNCVRDPAAGHTTEGGLNIVVYAITAQATLGAPGSASYVEREVTVSVAKCKDPNALMPDGTPDNRNRCP
jgi:MSHA biogenesis protein MshP